MASPYDSEVLLTRELTIIRTVKPDNEYGIDSYYLLYLLSHQYTQNQIGQKTFLETTLPNIGERWKELLLPVSNDIEERYRISRQVKSVIDAKWDALDELYSLRQRLGAITT